MSTHEYIYIRNMETVHAKRSNQRVLVCWSWEHQRAKTTGKEHWNILGYNDNVAFTRHGEFFLDVSSDIRVLVDNDVRRTRMSGGVYRHATIS